MDDLKLIRRITEGDQSAFRQLMERYHQLICYIVWQFHPTAAGIEDLVQEVYLRIYRSLPGYREKGSLKSWIGRITRNLCIDYLRMSKYRENSLEEVDVIATQALPEDEILRTEVKEQVRDALNLLPEHYRVTVVLRYYYDFTYQEISETLDIPIGTVMSRLNKARQLLRSELAFTERGEIDEMP